MNERIFVLVGWMNLMCSVIQNWGNQEALGDWHFSFQPTVIAKMFIL